MVAPRSDITVQPGLNNFSSFNIQSFPGTKIKLVPRNGTTPLWREEFNDLLSNCKRSHIIAMKGHPILTEFLASFLSRYPDTPAQQVMTAYAHEYMLYLQHNTDVYHLLRASMLMQGPSVEADIKVFHEHFYLNDYRDGKGLYTWAITQVPAPLSISAQSDLLDTFQNPEPDLGQLLPFYARVGSAKTERPVHHHTAFESVSARACSVQMHAAHWESWSLYRFNRTAHPWLGGGGGRDRDALWTMTTRVTRDNVIPYRSTSELLVEG